MTNIDIWWEIDEILEEPFLAINATNRDGEKLAQNLELLEQRKTGYWDIRRSVIDVDLKGRKVVLLFNDGLSRLIYVGRIKSLQENGVNKKQEPRYEIEVCEDWELIAQTPNNFSDFFRGFKFGAGSTYLWACEDSFDEGEIGNDIVDPTFEDKIGSDIEGMFSRRVGYHIFVNALKKVWGVKCALTGLSAPRLVQACHIIPWGKASPKEKVSADNGLLLCAHLHALFDENLIGFSRTGELLVDKKLSNDLLKLVIVNNDAKLRLQPTNAQAAYLQSHAAKNPNLIKYG